MAIEQSDFEAWHPRGRRVPAAVLRPRRGTGLRPPWVYAKAQTCCCRTASSPPFWNRVAWDRADVREALMEVYARAAPELSRDGPMHPANPTTDTGDDWDAGVAAVDGSDRCGGPFTTNGSRTTRRAEYAGLLATASEVRLLDPERREPFLAAVTEAIEAHGEPLSHPDAHAAVPRATWVRASGRRCNEPGERRTGRLSSSAHPNTSGGPQMGVRILTVGSRNRAPQSGAACRALDGSNPPAIGVQCPELNRTKHPAGRTY